MAYDEKLAQRVREILKGSKGVTEKRMFGGICFLLNGNMMGGVLKDDLIVKYAKEDHEKVIAQKHVRPFDFSGKPMAGIAYVGPEGLKGKKDLARWVEMGRTHAAALPKKQKKKQNYAVYKPSATSLQKMTSPSERRGLRGS